MTEMTIPSGTWAYFIGEDSDVPEGWKLLEDTSIYPLCIPEHNRPECYSGSFIFAPKGIFLNCNIRLIEKV